MWPCIHMHSEDQMAGSVRTTPNSRIDEELRATIIETGISRLIDYIGAHPDLQALKAAFARGDFRGAAVLTRARDLVG